jgi:hypothetical protein
LEYENTVISHINIIIRLNQCFWPTSCSPSQAKYVTKIIECADYVFKATLVPNTYNTYFNSDSSKTYGAMLLQISDVYKGNLTLGTVELLFADADINYTKNGERLAVANNDTGRPVIQRDNQYIFFASRSDFPRSAHNNPKNSFAVMLPYGTIPI